MFPRQQITHAKIEVLLETVFLLGPCRGVIKSIIEARELPLREDLSPKQRNNHR
jgi:hypothetical protein